jgi:mono/diheme cytochrome c family protein
MPIVKLLRNIAPLALAVTISSVCLCRSLWAADKDDSDKTKAVYSTNCKSCHGVDGGGTPIGKSINAPDLRSEAVQQHSDAQWTEQISGGKGNMPAFKNSLTPDQIQSLVRYVRQLGAAKPSTQK